MEEKIDLKPTIPVKPTDLGPEFAKLQSITDALNRARSDVMVPPGTKPNVSGEYSAESGLDGATTTLEDPIFGSPIPKSQGATVQQAAVDAQATVVTAPPTPEPPVQQPVPEINLSRIFFTGRSGSGKSYLAGLLGAAEFTIQSPIVRVLAEYFPVPQGAKETQDFLNLVIMWGEGHISDKVPITATRLLFADFARKKFGEDFGKPGFWTRQLLDSALSHDGQSVVTTCTDEKQATALKEAGFTHYHIMCSNPTLQTRKRRAGANDALANALDAQVLKAISMQKSGPKLKAIWCDTAAPTISGRLYDIGGFLAEAKGAQAPNADAPAGE